MIGFSEPSYKTEEPSSNDATVIKSITVLRSGDLSRTSIVRVSTKDNTAIAGVDYKPKTETLTFLPGVSALDFDVEIFYDSVHEAAESFDVLLGPQEPISAVFGKIVATNVVINDNNVLGNNTSFDSSLEALLANNSIFMNVRPHAASLYAFLKNETSGEPHQFSKNKEVSSMAPSDASLICFHVSLFICNHNSLSISKYGQI